jgi:hypothetical protein
MGKYTSDWQKPYVEKNRRFVSYCIYCGGIADTREHIPSRVFLDEPYADDMAVVPACNHCNMGYSSDEEYLACYLDVLKCTINGNSEHLRVKTKKAFEHSPSLEPYIRKMISKESDCTKFQCPNDKLEKVLSKLAIGHLANFYDRRADEYSLKVSFSFEPMLSEDEYADFNKFAEIQKVDGLMSDAIENILVFQGFDGTVAAFMPWIDVQTGNYRYQAYYDDKIDTLVVKIVIFEFLYAEVHCKVD